MKFTMHLYLPSGDGSSQEFTKVFEAQNLAEALTAAQGEIVELSAVIDDLSLVVHPGLCECSTV